MCVRMRAPCAHSLSLGWHAHVPNPSLTHARSLQARQAHALAVVTQAFGTPWVVAAWTQTLLAPKKSMDTAAGPKKSMDADLISTKIMGACAPGAVALLSLVMHLPTLRPQLPALNSWAWICAAKKACSAGSCGVAEGGAVHDLVGQHISGNQSQQHIRPGCVGVRRQGEVSLRNATATLTPSRLCPPPPPPPCPRCGCTPAPLLPHCTAAATLATTICLSCPSAACLLDPAARLVTHPTAT